MSRTDQPELGPDHSPENLKPTPFERLWDLNRPEDRALTEIDTPNGKVTLLKTQNETGPYYIYASFSSPLSPMKEMIGYTITAMRLKQEGVTQLVLSNRFYGREHVNNVNELFSWLPEKPLAELKQTLASHLADLLGA